MARGDAGRVTEFMGHHGIDVLCLQEYGSSRGELQSGAFVDDTGQRWLVTSVEGRKATAIVLAERLASSLCAVEHHASGATIAALDVGTAKKLWLASVHLPVAGKLDDYVQEAHSVLQSLRSRGTHWILAGDLNADLAPVNQGRLLDHATPPSAQARLRTEALGALLLEAAAQAPQLMLPTIQPTHHAWKTGTPSLKDYVIVPLAIVNRCQNSRLLHRLPLVSDHAMVLLDYALPARVPTGRRCRGRPRLDPVIWPTYQTIAMTHIIQQQMTTPQEILDAWVHAAHQAYDALQPTRGRRYRDPGPPEPEDQVEPPLVAPYSAQTSHPSPPASTTPLTSHMCPT